VSTIEEVDKQEFQNDSPGWLGATVITGRNQDPKAIPVEPGGRIFLSREEQLLTSRAHQRDEDSPFKNGLNAVSKPGKVSPDRLVPYDEALAEAAEPAPEEITGVEPQPAGEAAVGVQAQTEIAGTPEAQGKQPPPAPKPQQQKPQAPVPPKPAQ
jgi:hypothetical protein